MKQLLASRTLAIPSGINIEVKGRAVRVKVGTGCWAWRQLQAAEWRLAVLSGMPSLSIMVAGPSRHPDPRLQAPGC